MSAPSLQTQHLFNRLCFGGRIQDLSNPKAAIWQDVATAATQIFATAPKYQPLKSHSDEFMLDASELAKVEENRKVYPNSADEVNHNWLRHAADCATR
jgi:hypothetical protein